VTESKVVERDTCELLRDALFGVAILREGMRDEPKAAILDALKDSLDQAISALTAESAERKRMEGRVAALRELVEGRLAMHRSLPATGRLAGAISEGMVMQRAIDAGPTTPSERETDDK
jgi:hypothetical protein